MKKFIAVILALAASGFVAMPSWGALTGVTATSKKDVILGGENYVRVEGFMEGTVPNNENSYKTPVTILYPKKSNKSNGTAIINPRCYTMQETSYIDFGGQAMSTVSCGEDLFTEDFLGGRGYTYVDLHWNKYVLEAAAEIGAPINGYSIEDIKNPNDAWQIFADASSLAKAPPVGLKDMPAAQTAIMAAFSGGNMAPREYFLHRYQETNGDATPKYPRAFEYDGYLQIGMGPFCIGMDENTIFSGPSPCGVMLGEPSIADVPGTGKVMVYNTETDIQLFAGGVMEFMNAPNSRVYEVPGSHLPKHFIDVSEEIFSDVQPLPEFRQNIANSLKPIGAMVENLRQWIEDGTQPPPSVTLQGSPEPMYTGIPCSPFLGEDLAGAPICDHFGNSPFFAEGGLDVVFDVARDADKNATGGIRLPQSEVPLGEYNGLELGLFNNNIGAFELHSDLQPYWQRIIAWEAGGYYNRFTNEEINSRYPTHKIYVNDVVAAAQNALQNRWILPEDYVDYVVTAKQSAIGKQSTYSDADLEAAHGLDVFF